MQKILTTFAAIVLAAGLLSPLARAKSADIPSYTLTYSVQYRGTDLGELVIATSQQGEKVLVNGETFPNSIAYLLGDGKVKEVIEYQRTDKGLRLVKVTELMGKDFSKKRVAKVSPMADRIELSNEESYHINPSEQVDAYTFPFLSLLGMNDSSPGQQERVVSTKRVRKYVYDAPVAENISVPAGRFATEKSSKRRVGDSSKVITVWISEDMPRFPVKIEVTKKGKKDATITLIEKR